MKKFAVTGANGFIGKALVQGLLDQDESKIISIDNSDRFNFDPRVERVQSDISIDENLDECFRDVDCVFHLAASAITSGDFNNVARDLTNGITVAANVFQACARARVPKLVVMSSSSVYGKIMSNHAANENHPRKPLSLYGASKLAVEAYANSLNAIHDIHISVVRPATVIGPQMNHGVLPSLISQLKTNNGIAKLLGDGTQERGFLHIDDCVTALLHVSQLTHSGIESFNLGPEDKLSIKEVVEVSQSLYPAEIEVIFEGNENAFKGDVDRVWIDSSKLIETGWKPEMTSTQAIQGVAKHLISREIVNVKSSDPNSVFSAEIS